VRRLLRLERELGAEPELRDEWGDVPSDKGPVKTEVLEVEEEEEEDCFFFFPRRSSP
jgi:hypothetical protein